MQDPGLRRRIVHPENLPIFDRHVQEEGPTPGEIDFRIIRADGSCAGSIMVAGALLIKRSYPGIRGSNRDITERKQLETLSQSLNEINSSSTPIWILTRS